ncbi:DUF839 domain-containing protein [Ramlibacter henchirensis]|uniref:DUF839 domain-containing protein n=1 Tax=Ramlibacter henchirensis TaxID=204072 RepID=A0A4Z0BK97_9BURK|nr:alkaline phosphatase PhoX [Ramlibacter henchirensis]TFY99191.1 DUF839 domain-containing protein [Ramlibacter henchirensis]
MTSSRRNFIRFLGTSAAISPLAALYSRAAQNGRTVGPGFGDLSSVLPLNTADMVVPGVFDYRNQPLLMLPPGFRYWAISCTGQWMSDGTLVPGDHDGMAAFQGAQGTTILVRNHELINREPKFGNERGVDVPDALKFDRYATGGTTTLVLDAQGKLLRDFASLGGTNNNCAGGPTPWGSWLTCEESTALPDASLSTYQQRHGYVFEVPALADGPTRATPLRGMGRFNHEATAADPRTGIVYQTEDAGDGLFYRYVPNRRGALVQGGKLQALKLREFRGGVSTGRGFLDRLNQPMPVEWVDIPEPDARDDLFANSTRGQGQGQGAARFVRGEGAWWGDGLAYFCCTTGGNLGAGQIWAHDPVRETLTLVVESTNRAVLDAPDNITVGPDGRLYMFEDGSGGNNILGVDRSGELFRVATNAINASEFCGGCFSPDGRFLFVNIQAPGLTLVIEGPWGKGRP